MYMYDVLFIDFRPKRESGMPTDVLEAFVRADGNPLRDELGKMLEAEGFDFMDADVDYLSKVGQWDYYGKIL